ncbi:hypothetical protein MPSEU_000171100 [Mayamaea pseudoterrestris]|nr:hypothetical protein MPSEU_000171100 [Mayamaea pseudoterrestris]
MFLHDDASPFDQALAHPFLGEPVSKRLSSLSLFKLTSSKQSRDYAEDAFDLSYRGERRESQYKAPHATQETHEITFASSDHDGEDFSSGSFGLVSLEEGLSLDADVAIFRERLDDISEINMSMKHINQIQKDLAVCVESQDEGIHHLEYMAIETLESTSSGLSYLLKLQHEAAQTSKRRKQLFAGVSAAILIVSVLNWILSASQNVHGDDGPNEN